MAYKRCADKVEENSVKTWSGRSTHRDLRGWRGDSPPRDRRVAKIKGFEKGREWRRSPWLRVFPFMTVREIKNTTLIEKHFAPTELAEAWGFSARFVRELFGEEQGVILINRPEKLHKRSYITMRIPESVASRVYGRLTRRAA